MLPKFRVWCKNRNEWERDTCYIQQDGTLYQRSKGSERLIPILEKNHVVMQSTGLKDRNGVELFEGDVVRVSNHPFQKKEDSAGIEIDGNYLIGWSDHSLTWLAGDLLLHQLKPYIEVIGNIYEDKELLEVEG
ncbi:YopX family protein [Enterococcus hulanensis]|uniref:YopX family protein n=1 Tax=Enterococcus hulanensis TaxID=2559929 RepID=A0ABU3EX77_9ENTE|nr:YopX family protein [Enterococcus hulanensis]MDT2599468.1 YopX family protein [Enterococcus hulanensis]MDT2608875.1 YopX family protein [Enterococcus hulanensis]MDT2616630.1 YopX family protein [Enterococcus hulanensis]MDT2627330.1 YopX family protein [Enterococcus hulanensis]MDT2657196.1 YopX family protein [Enterococcus hulanensis]